MIYIKETKTTPFTAKQQFWKLKSQHSAAEPPLEFQVLAPCLVSAELLIRQTTAWAFGSISVAGNCRWEQRSKLSTSFSFIFSTLKEVLQQRREEACLRPTVSSIVITVSGFVGKETLGANIITSKIIVYFNFLSLEFCSLVFSL